MILENWGQSNKLLAEDVVKLFGPLGFPPKRFCGGNQVYPTKPAMILPHSAEPTNTVPGLRLLLDYHAQTGDIEVMDVKEPHHYTEKFGRKSVFKVAHDGPFKAEFVDEPNFVKRTAGESYKRSVFQSEGPKATFTPPAVGLWHIIIHLPQETAKKLHVQFFE